MCTALCLCGTLYLKGLSLWRFGHFLLALFAETSASGTRTKPGNCTGPRPDASFITGGWTGRSRSKCMAVGDDQGQGRALAHEAAQNDRPSTCTDAGAWLMLPPAKLEKLKAGKPRSWPGTQTGKKRNQGVLKASNSTRKETSAGAGASKQQTGGKDIPWGPAVAKG